MFFNAEEDEGDFLSPSSGSKLGALFGIDQASSQGGNESLKYSAPKQPKKKGESNTNSTGGAAPAVLNAAAVTAYKYTDGQYAKQGKVGAAVLGNAANKDFKILLYVSKQQQVTNAKIYSGFAYTVQANNYASFYDDARQSWSIMFDTEQAAINFSKHVCLAKALCGGGLTEVVSQDLTLGEGGPLESGDSAEVKYTGWLLTNNTFGKVFDSNASAEKLFRFKLGKGKVIKGWDIGVIGMKKNSKRILIVPPNFAYGDSGMGDRVPPNSTLIFEIEVVRVKLSKSDSRSESPTPEAGPGPVPVAVVLTNDDYDEATVKGRTRSITEQLSQSPKSDKAKLISRMAKMGKPMLPLSGAVPAMADEEEIQEGGVSQQQPVVQQSVPVQQNVPMVQPIPQQMYAQPPGQPINQLQYQQQPYQQQHLVNHIHQQPLQQQQQPPAFVQNLPSQQQQQHQLSLYQPIQPPINPYQQPNAPGYGGQPTNPYSNVFQPQAPSYPVPGPPQSTDVNTPILMSEARQQNTEVRLAVGKVTDKVDKILEKLEHMQVHGSGSSLAIPGNTQPMENGVLLHNIQKVIQDNERLKKELFEKSARIESQNEKIGDLLQRNQRYVEQSNMLLEQRNDTFKNTAAHSQARVLTLEQEKVQIATELSVVTAQISSLQLELSHLRKKEGETKQQLSAVLDDTGKNRDEVNILRIAHSDEQRKVNELTESLKEEKLNKRQLENQVTQLKEELGDLKLTNESLDKNLTERKKKSGDERKKLEEELEEVKGQLEEEIQVLKNKLRKQKSSTDAATAEQVAELEREITDEWKEKSEKLIKAAEDKHKRVLREIEEEKMQAQQNAKDLEKKVQTLKSSGSESDQQISGLQSRVEELEAWKEKYDKLRSQAGAMKEKYEERIEELEEEVENAKKTTTTTPGPAGDSASDVKKIMSSVYHSLRGELETNETYTGSEALTIILNTIKSETLKMTSSTRDEESEEGSEDEEEESEEEAEEKPVVIETLSAQTAVPTQGAKLSKASKSASPAKKKEDRSMASIEDDILSQLVGSEVPVTDKKSTSPKKESEIVKGDETLIKATSAYITGDKGNKYYSEELDKSKANEVIKEVIEPTIKSSKDAITGDKGNKYYTEELDKGKQPLPDKTKKEDKDKKPEDNKKKSEETTDAGFTSAEIEAMLLGVATSPSKSQPKIEPKKEKPVAVEPLLSSSSAATNMGGNPYYGKKLDQAGGKEVKAEVIEPMMASSTASSNLGAKPKDSPKKKAVVEPMVQKSSDKITGDKGNKYYTQELDKNRVAAVEGMVIKSSGHPTGGDHGNIHYSKHLDQSTASKDKAKVVEEPLLASASGGLTASAPKGDKSAHKPVPIEEPLFAATATSVTSAKPVIVAKVKKSVDHPTGDKGNKYHSEKLDKTDKITVKPIVQPAIVRSQDHPTGDKGNPHHTEKLNKSDKGGDVIKAEKSKGVHSTPPSGKAVVEEAIVSKATSGQTSAAPSGKNGKAVVEEAMVAKSTSGQTMAAPSPNKTQDKQSNKKAVVEPMIGKKTDHVTGDRGNPHHSAKLHQSASSKPKPAPIVEPLFSKSSNKPTGDKGNPYHSAKLDKTKGKDKSGVVPPVSSRDPPPLDDNNTDTSLFGEDNTVLDTFGTDFKPRTESVEKGDKKDTKKDDKKSGDKKQPSKVDLLADDSLKGKPPPLFGDEDDEDDLDWLS